jgi:phage terminase small subunit
MAGKKGKSGRKTTIPDDVKEMIGYRKDRINKDRPAVVQFAFVREPLTEKAQQFFDAFFYPLYERGVLSDSDSPGFHFLCRVYAQYVEAEENLLAVGQNVLTDKGPRTSSALKNFILVSDLYTKLLREFGLTPASRSGVVAPAAATIDVTPKKKKIGKPSAGKGYAGKDMD